MLRRASFVVLLFTAALASAAAIPAAAQEVPPGIGNPLTFVDPEGATRGTVTVTEVADPFLDFEPTRPPEEGQRYVLITASFEAAADQTMDAQPSYLELQDTNGSLWARQFVARPDDALIPELEGQTMAPGNRISGIVGYSVPEGAVIDRVLFRPASDRLFVLADLVPEAGPAPGDAVPYADAAGGSAEVSALVEDPFTGFEPGYPPEPGTRFVLLTVTFDNVGPGPYAADPYDVLVRDADGYVYGKTTVYRPADVVLPDLESQTMAPGNRVSGAIGFAVREQARLVEVLYQVQSDRIVVLADLTGGGQPPEGEVTAEPTTSPTEPPVATAIPVPSAPPPTAVPSPGTAR